MNLDFAKSRMAASMRALRVTTAGGVLSVTDVSTIIAKCTPARLVFVTLIALVATAALPLRELGAWAGLLFAWELLLRPVLDQRIGVALGKRSQHIDTWALAAINFIGTIAYTAFPVLAWDTHTTVRHRLDLRLRQPRLRLRFQLSPSAHVGDRPTCCVRVDRAVRDWRHDTGIARGISDAGVHDSCRRNFRARPRTAPQPHLQTPGGTRLDGASQRRQVAIPGHHESRATHARQRPSSATPSSSRKTHKDRSAPTQERFARQPVSFLVSST